MDDQHFIYQVFIIWVVGCLGAVTLWVALCEITRWFDRRRTQRWNTTRTIRTNRRRS